MASSTKTAPATAKPPAVTLNLAGGGSLPLRLDDSLREVAWRWNYALRNRSRWASRDEAAQRQRDEIARLVAGFGLNDAALARIVDAGLVEVSMPFVREELDWQVRIFPWEYVLATATRLRRKANFAVVRHLRCRKRSRAKAATQDNFLYVESSPPGPVATAYSFSEERRLAEAAAASAQLQYLELLNPTLAELTAAVARHRPRIIHLAGVDNHLARELSAPDLPLKGADAKPVLDGYYMRRNARDGEEVSAIDVARALTTGGAQPELVSFNLDNSAPRLAALCVAEGAHCAIGLQDSFDEQLAELFFATLYRAWQLGHRDMIAAFCYAWQQLRRTKRRITGTGLVMWRRASITDASVLSGPGSLEEAVSQIDRLWRAGSARVVTPETARTDLAVHVDHVTRLNYSMLHNGRPLFKSLSITKQGDDIGEVAGIDVNVELHVGRDAFPFRRQVTIAATQPAVEIGADVRLSLASSLSRAVRENIHTSLLIEVALQGQTLFRETRRVTLLPIDEWEDSDANRKWLPSFVLPRDPAVARVIDQAQRYLQALRDDPTAGFDGYQALPEAEAKGRFDYTDLDRQVQAIWCALLYELPLSYINPPPSFTNSSQRLRSPSEVIDGHRGTCIDLALLLASCLEYVDIYPTIVLLQDHAFPCYWRSDTHFNDFALARPEAIGRSTPQRQPGTPAPAQQTDSWYYVKDHFREVMAEIAAGRLVPIEATGLCWRHGFAQAIEQGRKNLSRRSRFDSMLDIRAARMDEDSAVTPLPMLRLEAGA